MGGLVVVLEGLDYKDNVALGGVIRCVQVDLHNAAFGIKIGDFETPQIYLAQTPTRACFDEATGSLTLRERPRGQPGRGLHLPKLWLDLPWDYGDRKMGPVAITARGYVEVNGINIDTLEIDTWGDIACLGVHLGSTCMAKSVGGSIRVTELAAPMDTDPQYGPTVELIAPTGTVEANKSSGSWRLAAAKFSLQGVEGPQHITDLAPRPQQVKAAA